MNTSLSFWVPGIPAPGGSKRVFGIKKGGAYTGRFIVTDDAGQRNKDWRNAVIWAAKEVAPASLLSGPLSVSFAFYMPRPKGHFNSKGILKASAPAYPVTKPDALKLARSTEDALTSVVWGDDCQVVELQAVKLYCVEKPGARVLVSAMARQPQPAPPEEQG